MLCTHLRSNSTTNLFLWLSIRYICVALKCCSATVNSVFVRWSKMLRQRRRMRMSKWVSALGWMLLLPLPLLHFDWCCCCCCCFPWCCCRCCCCCYAQFSQWVCFICKVFLSSCVLCTDELGCGFFPYIINTRQRRQRHISRLYVIRCYRLPISTTNKRKRKTESARVRARWKIKNFNRNTKMALIRYGMPTRKKTSINNIIIRICRMIMKDLSMMMMMAMINFSSFNFCFRLFLFLLRLLFLFGSFVLSFLAVSVSTFPIGCSNVGNMVSMCSVLR